MNAVEVQIGEGAALGVAVYGPWFSWFNHSCSPNSSYRFELAVSELGGSCETGFRVSPAGSGLEEADMLKTWICDESKLNQGLCRYGPRVVVRSIKPIKKGQEVCITYTDLLQPKALRHSDLWSKYRFVCCCNRCNASPETYVDHILSGNAANHNCTNVNSEHEYEDEASEDPADVLDQAITEFLSIGNPKACCEKIENMLSENFQCEQCQLEEPLKRKFKLHPLHHISLNAYITLASCYRIRSTSLLTLDSGEEDILEAFEMSKAAAAYSLLLAGATHHLYLSESSLIITTALSWIRAGESFLVLFRSSARSPAIHLVNASEFSSIFPHSQDNTTQRNDSPVAWDEFKVTTISFLNCILRISSSVWLFLVSGLPFLRCIRSPLDFSLFEMTKDSAQLLVGGSHIVTANETCLGCKYEAQTCIEEEMKGCYQLAIHCLIYGGYLASICYGARCYSMNHVRNILNGEIVVTRK